MINWQQIDTVLLDMDGTLLDLHYDNYFWNEFVPDHYAGLHGLEPMETRQSLVERFRSRLGQLEFYCIEHWSADLGLDLLALKQAVNHKIRFLPGALELLQHISSQPLSSVLITNAHRKVLDIKQEQIGITDYVDAAYASHEFDAPKEDDAFWPRFMQKHPFDPERTLFIDDNLAVLQAAQRFGVRHLVQPLQPDSTQAANAVNPEHSHLQIHSLEQLLPGSDRQSA